MRNKSRISNETAALASADVLMETIRFARTDVAACNSVRPADVAENRSAPSVMPVDPYLLDGRRGAREDGEIAAVGFIAIQASPRHPSPVVESTFLDAHQ